jgi:hypothetical protein
LEGFLISLTTRKGKQRRMGRLFYKRLYFSTFDHYLLFSRPKVAETPIIFDEESSSGDVGADNTESTSQKPVASLINPFPIEDGKVTWAGVADQAGTEEYDQAAYEELGRRIDLVTKCDGLIDLTDVAKVRNLHRVGSEMEQNSNSLTSEAEIDNNDASSSEEEEEDEGSFTNFNDSCTFELVLRNGLVMRFQAPTAEAKKMWKKKLRKLVKYWRYRTLQDTQIFKDVRRQNLEELQMDEEGEATIGQTASKWELSQYVTPEEGVALYAQQSADPDHFV